MGNHAQQTRHNDGVRNLVQAFIAMVTLACLVGLMVVPGRLAHADEVNFDLGNTSANGSTISYEISVRTPTGKYGPDGRPIYGKDQLMEPDADGNYDFDPMKYDTDDGNAIFTIDSSFTIPEGALNGANTIMFQLPPSVQVYEEFTDEPVKDGSGMQVGTYTVSKDGTVKMTLNSATVEGNASHGLSGRFRYEVQLSDDAMKDGAQWELPGTGQQVNIGRKYDVHVKKNVQSGQDCPDGKYCYALHVSSTYGTEGEVHVDDHIVSGQTMAVSNVHIQSSPAGQEVDSSACTVDGDTGHMDCTLPALQGGEGYVIAYQADFPESAQDSEVKNQVAVSSDGEHSGHIGGTDEATVWIPKPENPDPTPSVNKKADNNLVVLDPDKPDERYIKWTVTLNANKQNLKHAHVVDTVGKGLGQPVHIEMVEVGRPSNKPDVTTFPDYKLKSDGFEFTFPATDDYATYELTYYTKIDDTQLLPKLENTVAVMLNGGRNEQIAGYENNRDVVEKSSVSMSEVPGEERQRILTWHVDIGSDDIALPKAWTYTDTLQDGTWPFAYTHYFSEEQQDQIYETVMDFFEERRTGTGRLGVDVVFPSETEFQIIVQKNAKVKPLQAGEHLSFDFSSTVEADFPSVTQGADFVNKGDLSGFTTEASLHFAPNIMDIPGKLAKYDALDNKAPGPDGSTGHDIATLPHTQGWRQYLSWQIEWWPSSALVEAARKDPAVTATIVERLPDGLTLLDPSRIEQDGPESWNERKETCAAVGGDGSDGNGNRDENGRCLTGVTLDELTGFSFNREFDGRFAILDEQGTIGVRATDGSHVAIKDRIVATLSQQGNDVVITLSNELLQAMGEHMDAWTEGIWKRAKLFFRINAYFSNWKWNADQIDSDGDGTPDFNGYDIVKKFDNSVEWTDVDGKTEHANSAISLFDAESVLGKEVTKKNSPTNTVSYELNINPKAQCLGQTSDAKTCLPERYSFTDTASYMHLDDYGNAVVKLDETATRVYEVLGNAQQDGDGAYTVCPAGQENFAPIKVSKDEHGTVSTWRTTPNDPDRVCVRQLDPSQDEYSVRWTSQHPESELIDVLNPETGELEQQSGAEYQEILEFTVPNARRLIIDYDYIMTGDLDDEAWVTLNNTANLNGVGASPTDTNVQVNLKKSHAVIDGYHVTIHKVDRDNVAKMLGGATFSLNVYDPKSQSFVATGVTLTTAEHDEVASDGTIMVQKGSALLNDTVYKDLRPNTAYELVETQAPAGYGIGEPSYFLINDPDHKTYPDILPEGFRKSPEYKTQIVTKGGTKPVVQIVNEKEQTVLLPATGGTTANLLVLAGAVMVFYVLICAGLVVRCRTDC